ncbi:hypothetical protein VKI21_13600 [Cyanobacterium aponinum UTEX 3222]|uniref:Uncharacterized protein n=1 Tax=Cyanobacterium aponinum 0216 TaxID=2676140 RepID=A0A844H0D6_9CHRO|nr:hypothetical protein [Cyanobacterium aponinum]MTF40509.1 hypothetical protein [Cyanobacterium aponinum 0216]PHV62748.1 hypothetical protein CSQ80_08505 [Cyanobacterium aponinum IPPAS B-1201]WRL41085.1 hypothetical protein VKI21_13600 [Cyanobacterium aponinum UTEX 3222]
MSKTKTQEEKNLEDKKLREILILLDQLFRREEATAKGIVGCLYDIATINLINKYCPLWGINATLKYLTRFPRPLAKSLGVKLYLQPKCPQLITDWLYSLVEFPDKQIPAIEPKIIETELLPTIRKNRLEIESLRHKVKLLTGTLVATFILFSSGFAWVSYNLQMNPMELLTTSTFIENEK